MIESALLRDATAPAVPGVRSGISGQAFALGFRRSIILCILCVAGSLDYLFRTRGGSLVKRAHWLHRWCQRCARLLGMKFDMTGTAPRTGLVVANHLSYLDIIALSAISPSLFVAKSDVARWPVFGLFARMAGTIFVDRTRRSDVARTAAELKAALLTGLPVVLFPEGTSSDGRDVLAFKSSLLQPACEGTNPITPVAIDYTVAEGSVGDLVCYWGDMTLLPHLLNLLMLCEIGVHLSYGSVSCSNFNRKALAAHLRQEIVALRHLQAARHDSGPSRSFA